ncbi:sialic acid synthase [Bacillus rossius redtenbacheri]|uniref:sialic acid synthase n=1 Tax=Bacillus rossius redtenbacheri TaxID=93214 RepID=UPI002FDD022B
MAEDIEITPGKVIGSSHPCFIIAEIGQNHQGDIKLAKQLIHAAKDSGADCVKFQKSSLADKFNAGALARPYPGPHSWGETYGQHKQHLEFSLGQFRELQACALDLGLVFSASAMDMVSVDELDSINVPFIKIGSGDADNFPLLQHAASKQRPLIISTGMQCMETVREMYQTVRAVTHKFCLLHCVSSYPTPDESVNLRVINTFRQEFPDIHVGYSGHELGTAISVAAVAMGAKVLERHLTLDKSWKGSDHACSLTPAELSRLVGDVRCVERALGSPTKRRLPCEEACHAKLGKTLVAARRLEAGRELGARDLLAKVAEPRGFAAARLRDLIGRTLRVAVERDQSILPSYVHIP